MKPFVALLICALSPTLNAFAESAGGHQAMLLRQQLHFEKAGDQFRAHSPGYSLEISREDIRVWAGAKSVEIRFVSSPGAQAMTGEKPLPGIVNRLMGADSSGWQQGIKTFGRVRLEQVYPGIDVVFYGNGLELEYDFEVAPGASPEIVEVEFSGAECVTPDEDGGLRLGLGEVTLRQRAPLVFQMVDGERMIISSRYSVDDAGRAKFVLGDYDRNRQLVIDPVLEFSTYLGDATNEEKINDVAVDGAGNIYVTGTTYMYTAPSFPLKNAFQTVNSFLDNNQKIFISKHAFVSSFDRKGQLIFSTYFGGYHDDEGHAIAVGKGEGSGVYVTGWTRSMNPFVFVSFPVTPGAYATNMLVSANQAPFLAKFSVDGQLVYSTMLFQRAGNNTLPQSVDVDASGNAYVAGEVAEEWLTQPDGVTRWFDHSGFVLAVNAAGSRLIYTNSLGSSFGTSADIAVEPNGTAHVSGQLSGNQQFYGTPDAYDGTPITLGGQNPSGFLRRYSPSGTLLYSSRAGGDGISSVAVAPDGSTIFVGSVGFPSAHFTPTNGLQMIYGGGNSDAYVARLDTRVPGKAGLKMQSYLGGSGSEGGYAVAVDSEGNILVTGGTSSTNFPLAGAVQSNLVGGNSDAFATKINAAATGIIFSSYLGGSKDDYGIGIAAIPNSPLFVIAGNTTSTNFPMAAPYQGQLKGTNSNGFIARIGTEAPAETFTVNSDNDLNDGSCDTAHCSLREAINASNQRAGVQTISFNIPNGLVPPMIKPTSALPPVTAQVIIDGFTQPGYRQVEFDGALAGPGVDGLVVQASSSTFRSLVIRGFSGNGLVLRGHLNTVERCVIGMDFSAMEKKGNVGHGILIDNASGNLIGDLGNSTNIISGNGKNGIHIQGFGSDENFILGNIIGFNPEDNRNVGNGGHGVAIHGGKANWVGSELALLPNYIGGNTSNGIHIAGTAAGSSFIVGNRIGFGFFFRMENANGIEIHGSSKHLIGGVSSNAQNIISGNLKNGIYIHGFAHDNKIQGNLIGLHKHDFDPPPAGGNEEDGIRISDASNGTLIGGSTTQRGFGAGNTIVGNRGYGISIDRQSENTVIEGNAIGTDRQSGTKRLGNGLGGIRTVGPGTRIGGPKEAQGNLISGHDFGGIFVEGPQAATIIQGNKIGVTIGGGGINLNSDDVERSFFEIKVKGSEKVWIGGDLPAGTQIGQPPGNIIGGGITFEAVSASAIFGNSIGLNFQGEFLSAARVDIEGWRNWVGSPRGSNEISGGVALKGSKNVLQGNRLGITRLGAVISENETQTMVHLQSAGDFLIGGRRPGEANSIIGGREGVWVDCFGANGILGNEIRGFKEVAITTNKLAVAGAEPPVIVDASPDNLFSSDGMANVRFAPFAPGESGEVEVFGSSATGLLNPKPDALKLVGRARIPQDGTLTNVIVRLRDVAFDELSATITKKGGTTSPLSERVQFGTLADADSDGIPDAFETLGDGDANNDGIQDKQQGKVWGFPSYNGSGSVTVEMKTPGSLGFIRSREDIPAPIIPDKALRLDMAYPLELQIRLPAQDGKTGKAATPGVVRLEIFPPAATRPNAFLIYKDFQWSEFTYDGTTGAEILADRVVLHLVDNQRGDETFFPENTIHFKGILATVLPTPPPLRIEEVRKAPGDEIFLRYSGASETHLIEETANFLSWTSILTNPPSATEPSAFIPASTNAMRFFRVRTPEPE